MCLEQISDEYSMKKRALPGLSQVVTYHPSEANV
jgi:hypothetical protein